MVASACSAAPKRKLPLLPADPLGARFCSYFNHPWNFIQTPVPESGQSPNWRTQDRYPLEPRNLWEMYKDPDQLVGLRFGAETRYALIDIDKDSPYHPDNHPEKFQLVLQATEKIGLCRHLLVRSSESCGLHIYFFLSEPVPTFGLACALKFALTDQGLQLSAGQLEIFPNVKAYNKNKPTNYNAHRLPLQTNSWLLDSDLQPVTNDISHFLNVAEVQATKQDIEELKEAIAAAVQRQKLFFVPNTTNKAEVWKRHLETRINQGWTASGQTNELLKDFGTYGVVWLALNGQQLTNYIEKTAINAPGYQQYCSHHHEIRQRAREWAVAVESFYSPYCSHPERLKTYFDTFNKDTSSSAANNVVPFHNPVNEQRRAQATERIKNAIAQLDATNTLPTAATARAKVVVVTIKKLTGVTVSHKTLYKENYLPLWHPRFDSKECGINELEKNIGDSTESDKTEVPTSAKVIQTPNPLSEGSFGEIPTPPPYMKVGAELSAPNALPEHLGADDLDEIREKGFSPDVVESVEVKNSASVNDQVLTIPTPVIDSLPTDLTEEPMTQSPRNLWHTTKIRLEELSLGSSDGIAPNDLPPRGSCSDFELNDGEAEDLETPAFTWFTYPNVDETDESQEVFVEPVEQTVIPNDHVLQQAASISGELPQHGDETTNGTQTSLKVGDCVIWHQCPGHLKWLSPFLIGRITDDGTQAHLDPIDKSVPLHDLEIFDRSG